jgi:hypothetical protein
VSHCCGALRQSNAFRLEQAGGGRLSDHGPKMLAVGANPSGLSKEPLQSLRSGGVARTRPGLAAPLRRVAVDAQARIIAAGRAINPLLTWRPHPCGFGRMGRHASSNPPDVSRMSHINRALVRTVPVPRGAIWWRYGEAEAQFLYGRLTAIGTRSDAGRFAEGAIRSLSLRTNPLLKRQ